MSKATYYSDLLQPRVFDVLKKNDDGTVDIGIEDEDKTKSKVIVRSCPVKDKKTRGCVVLGVVKEDPEETEETETEPSPDQPPPAPPRRAAANRT